MKFLELYLSATFSNVDSDKVVNVDSEYVNIGPVFEIIQLLSIHHV